MNLYGYSERGVLNALLYSLQYAVDNDAMFNKLLERAIFPLTDDRPPSGTVTVLVEQSLSQFGDTDAVILISSPHGNATVFVEAKVQPAQSGNWHISNQFAEFEKGLEGTVNSSNLFTQLYHKQRMISCLKQHGLAALQQGIEFPSWSFPLKSKRRRRKIGTNPVVLRAVEYIRQHSEHVFFLMLIPEQEERAASFFNNTLRTSQFSTVPAWDPASYGYLSWAAVQDFCKEQQLATALDVFTYNKGQIFSELQ